MPPAISGDELKKHIFRDGPGVRAVLAVSTPAGAGKIALTMPQRVLLKRAGEAQKAAASPRNGASASAKK